MCRALCVPYSCPPYLLSINAKPAAAVSLRSCDWGNLQEEAAKTAARLTEQRALALTARAATKKVMEKARQEQDRDVTLRDPRLIENYKVWQAA